MANYKKQRARELTQDRFRDTTMNYVDRAGDRLAGKGRTILYGLLALAVVGALALAYSWWSRRKANEAYAALGRAIKVAEADVSASPQPGAANQLFFPNAADRAKRAVEEFQRVGSKYGGTTGEIARYFAANQQFVLDRGKGMGELEALTKSGNAEVAALSKFALAQAKESDGKYDEAAALYSDLAKQNGSVITPDAANLRLAAVYDKQGKKAEAVNLLFGIVEAARKAKDKDGKPVPQSAAAREASGELQRLDPERYAQLPPDTTEAGGRGLSL